MWPLSCNFSEIPIDVLLATPCNPRASKKNVIKAKKLVLPQSHNNNNTKSNINIHIIRRMLRLVNFKEPHPITSIGLRHESGWFWVRI